MSAKMAPFTMEACTQTAALITTQIGHTQRAVPVVVELLTEQTVRTVIQQHILTRIQTLATSQLVGTERTQSRLQKHRRQKPDAVVMAAVAAEVLRKTTTRATAKPAFLMVLT